MSGGKFRVFNPYLSDYSFTSNYDNFEGVEMSKNEVVSEDQLNLVKSFRVDDLLNHVSSKNDSEVSNLVSRFYLLVQNINYCISGDYRPNKWKSTYQDCTDQISEINNIDVEPEYFMLDKSDLKEIYSTNIFEVDDIEEVYEVEVVDSVKCLEDITEFVDFSDEEEDVLRVVVNVLESIRDNNLNSVNNGINELKSLDVY